MKSVLFLTFIEGFIFVSVSYERTVTDKYTSKNAKLLTPPSLHPDGFAELMPSCPLDFDPHYLFQHSNFCLG